jgi:hypothetical protein
LGSIVAKAAQTAAAGGWVVVAGVDAGVGVADPGVPPVAVGPPVGVPPAGVEVAPGVVPAQAASSTAAAKSVAKADLVTEPPFRHTTLAERATARGQRC